MLWCDAILEIRRGKMKGQGEKRLCELPALCVTVTVTLIIGQRKKQAIILLETAKRCSTMHKDKMMLLNRHHRGTCRKR